jgi:D-aminopeptidase
VIAFSTTNRVAARPAEERGAAAKETSAAIGREEELSPLFRAVIEATEEAIYNSLLRATTVRGRDGHTAEAIPIDKLRELLKTR